MSAGEEIFAYEGSATLVPFPAFLFYRFLRIKESL